MARPTGLHRPDGALVVDRLDSRNHTTKTVYTRFSRLAERPISQTTELLRSGSMAGL